jgi:hypothetical protein
LFSLVCLIANKEKGQAIADLVFARRLLVNFMIYKYYWWGNLRASSVSALKTEL